MKYLSRVFCLCLFYWAPLIAAEPAVEDTLIVLSTGDIHGAIDQFPRLATVVQAYRHMYPNVLLLNSGDLFTGNPYVDSAPERGQAVTDMMQRLGYTASVLGNHEFDYTQDILLKRMKEAEHIHFICSNLAPDARWEGYVSEEHTCFIPKLNLRVVLFGCTNVESCQEKKIEGLHFSPIKVENYLAYKDFKRMHQADLSIYLSHMGLGNDEAFAQVVTDTDLIVGGHTHDVLPKGKDIASSHLVHTGSRLEYLGVTRLVFAPRVTKKQKPVLISKSTQLIALDESITPDPKFQQLLRHYKLKLDLNIALGEAETKLNHQDLGALFCDAMRQATHADIAMYNGGGVRMQELPAGSISMKDVLTLEPFRSEIVSVQMRAGDIEEMILEGAKAQKKEGKKWIDIYPSGFDYTIILDVGGNPVKVESSIADRGKLYTVAMGDYIASRYKFRQHGEVLPLGMRLSEVIAQYIKQFSPIKAKEPRVTMLSMTLKNSFSRPEKEALRTEK